ncbi:hypothetical protein WJX73_001133 [Symbiochloris irregularis]|uniref:UDENN domain-containing protein n=1 Tax=Symbiochloris irregularis TaxID=706552 RepID=A0AAW1NP27_9CHLO
MLRTCFVARLVGDTTKAVDIFCRFEPSVNGQNKLPELPSAQNLGTFCFPTGASDVKPREYGAPEEFTFTLTGGDGSKTHGFCRTFLPPRTKALRPQQNVNLRYPQVVCIISKNLWLPFFFKVLQVVEALLKQGDLLTESAPRQMPLNSPTSHFLLNLLLKAGDSPRPGAVLRLDLPQTGQRLNVSPPRRMLTERSQARCTALQCTDKFIELQVPAECGSGLENAGVPLAKLLYYVRGKALVTLIEALLLERRILMLAEDSDRVTSAVHAAAALLWPFRWQHIYLPLLPHALQDYLLAPMPFLVGVPAAGSFAGLQSTPLEEITVVNLDAGTCTPGPGLPPAEPSSLPWAEELASALQAHTALLRSPSEWEISPRVSMLMQTYFLKLMSRYRDFMEADADQAAAKDTGQSGPSSSHVHNYQGSVDGLRLSRRSVGPVDDDAGYLRANGWRFHHAGLVASHRRHSTRAFLEAFRHSQMYEVFITQRLALASMGYNTEDTFEVEVEAASRRGKQIKQIVSVGAKGVSKGKALLQRAGHSVKTLRHSIGGMDDLLSSNNLPSRLSEATAGPAVSLPMMSGAMAETTNFFTLDEDEESGSDDEESAMQRDSQGSELPLRSSLTAPISNPPSQVGREDEEAYEAASSSRTASVDVMNSSSFGLAAPSRSITLPSNEAGDRSPVRPASGASTPLASPGPAAMATSSSDAFASRLPHSSDAQPVPSSSPTQPAPPAHHPSGGGPPLRASLPRPSPSLLDPLSSIDPFGRHAAPPLHSPQPSASPVADTAGKAAAATLAWGRCRLLCTLKGRGMASRPGE